MRLLKWFAIAASLAGSLVVLHADAQERLGPWFVIGRHPDPTNYTSQSVSLSGARIPGNSSSIVDSGFHVWTLGSGTTPNIVILRDGVQAAGAFGAQILWYLGDLYVQGDDLQWYLWNGSGFGFFGSDDPEGTSSPCTNGTSAAVVPCGFGYGMSTRAAYACGTDPTIYRVVTTVDDNTNNAHTNPTTDGSRDSSLRAALTASGPRVVIFETSGMIDLNSDIQVTSPCLTVAGQTAPSPGITIRGAIAAGSSAGGFFMRSHDILWQHLRIRPGDGGPVLPQTSGHDAFDMYYVAGDITQVHDIVLDHMSISWAAGKQLDIFQVRNTTNVTLWKSIVSEALYRAKNITQAWSGTSNNPPSGLGFSIGDSGMAGTGTNYTVTIYGNLFAHDPIRVPEVGSGDVVHLINNVIYDFGKDVNGGNCHGTLLYTPDGSNPWLIDIIGNAYIVGPGTGNPYGTCYGIWNFSGNSGSKFYLNDNTFNSSAMSPCPGCQLLKNDSPSYQVFSPALSESGFTVLAGSATKATVLNWVGARPRNRDTVDNRIVTETTNLTAMNGTSCPGLTYTNAAVPSIPGRICSQEDVGSWPVLSANVRKLTLPSSPHSTSMDGSGYTNLEVWLHGYATGVEQ